MKIARRPSSPMPNMTLPSGACHILQGPEATNIALLTELGIYPQTQTEESAIVKTRLATAEISRRLLTPRKFYCLCGQDKEAPRASDPLCSAHRGMIARLSLASRPLR